MVITAFNSQIRVKSTIIKCMLILCEQDFMLPRQNLSIPLKHFLLSACWYVLCLHIK